MPKVTREKIGEIHRVRTEQTFLEKLGEFVGGVFLVCLVFIVLAAIFG